MDLFSGHLQERLGKESPLAARMRPRSLDEFIGQESVVGEGTLLRRAIESDNLGTSIFWGPPGSGKTTLARIVAGLTSSHFQQISAVSSGVAEVRSLLREAEERRALHGTRTILFIDEIHRFNKAQQDALLSAVEDGVVTLIGATTENPYFEVNPALVSRSTVYRLEPLSPDELKVILRRALKDEERGLGKMGLEVDEDALEHLVRISGGDARVALNALEAAAFLAAREGSARIDLGKAEAAALRKALLYDKSGDGHYDTISAFIKSMRGSHPDAALYWLALMLEAGEDPRFIARRMVIFASEDVGLADSRALLVAEAAARAVEFVGLPEARLNLAHAAIYLSLAPKSNSVIAALGRAAREVREGEREEVPPHLRDAHYRGAADLGHGYGYLYPHDFPGHFVEQEYMPPRLRNVSFYRPSDSGEESGLVEDWLRRSRRGGDAPGSGEGLGKEGSSPERLGK